MKNSNNILNRDLKAWDLIKINLQNNNLKNELSNSYLFYGPGEKNLTALQFSKIILCEGNIRPCKGKCCKMFDNMLHPDFKIIKREKDATGILIPQIRDLIRSISLKSSGRRVIMIKNVEYLTEQAANAFLKTLEEPPLNTTFILTTSNIQKVIPTILSRCQGFYISNTIENKQTHDRENKTMAYLSGDLVKRFQISSEISKDRRRTNDFLNGIIIILRFEMIKEKDNSKRKIISSEIKIVTSYCILLKQNVSARLILEDLSLRLKRLNL